MEYHMTTTITSILEYYCSYKCFYNKARSWQLFSYVSLVVIVDVCVGKQFTYIQIILKVSITMYDQCKLYVITIATIINLNFISSNVMFEKNMFYLYLFAMNLCVL